MARTPPLGHIKKSRPGKPHGMTTKQLIACGQSYWRDNLTRDMLTSGALHRHVTEEGLQGITSNPATFHTAIVGSQTYGAYIRCRTYRPYYDDRTRGETRMSEQGFKVDCSGMAHSTPPDPCVVVIFGVAGDLGRTTLVPSLYALACQKLLPEPCAILGVARRDWDDETFRDEMRQCAQDSKDFSDVTWQQFAQCLYFVGGDFGASSPETYTILRQRLSQIQAAKHIADNVLFHLAVSPSLYGVIAQQLATASLLQSPHGWRRIILEKPFGYDEASARALDRQLLTVVSEEQLYRVDHYLGKETVQNMLVFRFANPSFEPIWNRHYIDHVQITAAESEGIGTRAGYYDTHRGGARHGPEPSAAVALYDGYGTAALL